MSDNVLKYKNYITKIKYDSSENTLYGKLEGIIDLVDFYAESLDAIKNEFHSAVDDYLEFCKNIGKEPQKPFKGNFNVRIPEDLHRRIFIEATKQNISLNQYVCNALNEKLNADRMMEAFFEQENDMQILNPYKEKGKFITDNIVYGNFNNEVDKFKEM